MEIIVGRDQQTRRLCVVEGGQTRLYGQPGSVPMDVSRHHISLDAVGDGKWKMKNINAQNVTFVNGISVETKVVSEADKVELGNSHFLLEWAALSKPKVETVDIRPLNKIWDDYKNEDIRIKKHQEKLGILASIPILLTMVGSVIVGCFPEIRAFTICLTTIAAVAAGYCLYKRLTFSLIDEQEKLKTDFQQRYVCPNPKCHHFMGYQDYEVLIQNAGCPYCKMKYKK